MNARGDERVTIPAAVRCHGGDVIGRWIVTSSVWLAACGPVGPRGEPPTEARPPAVIAPTPAPAPVASNACEALASCCAGTDAETYCMNDVAKGDAIGCALSHYWNGCPDRPKPDVDASGDCFRTRAGCHDSLLAACRVQGCADERGVHGCMVSGVDRRDVVCGNW